jgi:sugar (pentulose or hexulose) kinase
VPEELIVVLDVGKSLAKLSAWTTDGALVSRTTRPNQRIDTGRYVALDLDGIEQWIAGSLADVARLGTVNAIIPVGHGAAAVVVRDGRNVCPPIDYEVPIPRAVRRDYDAQRDTFAATGSPALPDGLNLGAQLYYLSRLHPGLLDGNTQILMWPQYWAWRLSGVAASEVTSLACHTDLWRPRDASLSQLVDALGWTTNIPPLRRADDLLGTMTEEWRERSGLSAGVAIYCGLHDSNAALIAARGFAELADDESTIVSTGTWFVAMRSPADGAVVDPASLSEARDCLVNVDPFGKLIPSSRFMGGREIELLTGLDASRIDIVADQPALLAAVPAVVARGSRVLPTFAPGFGPFPSSRGRWIDMPVDRAERRAAVSLYAALVTDVALSLIGARERILIEGRFAEAQVFIRALASLRPDCEIYVSSAHDDVSYGALRLLDPGLKPAGTLDRVAPLEVSLDAYRSAWARDADDAEQAA